MKVKMTRDVMWSPLGEPGLEHLKLLESDEGLNADALVIGVDEHEALRVHYELRCDAAWRVRQLSASLLGDHPRELELTADGAGHWFAPNGTPIAALEGCIDVDISITPFTNTLPIRRLQLKQGEAAEITVAYIAATEMTARPMRQRYTCLEANPEGGRYLYEGLESDFTAELTVNKDGLVTDYQGIWKMVWLAGRDDNA